MAWTISLRWSSPVASSARVRPARPLAERLATIVSISLNGTLMARPPVLRAWSASFAPRMRLASAATSRRTESFMSASEP